MTARDAWRATKRLLFGRERKLRRIWAGPLRGLRLGLRGEDLRIRLGLYEPQVSYAIDALHGSGSGCLDIGCAWGYHTLHMARLGSEWVVGLDADPKRVEWANRALNAYSRDHPHAQCEHVDRIPGWPSLVKMDVEGQEVEILEASTDMLTRKGPHLILETHSLELQAECLRILETCNYPATYTAEAPGTRTGRGWLVATGHEANWFNNPAAIDALEAHPDWRRTWISAPPPQVVAR